MAIDRGPWNALQDDDGSNLVGSVWNKAAIQAVILDPVDALVGTRVDVAYSASWYGPEAGTWTVAAGSQATYSYSVIGKKATVTIFLAGTELSGATTQAFRIYYTFGTSAKDVAIAFPYYGPVVGTGYALAPAGANYIRLLRDVAGTPWPIGPNYLFAVTLTIWLQ
jgi:hypothetical protein